MKTKHLLTKIAIASSAFALGHHALANPALEAEIQVSASGLVSISHEQLAASGIDWSGIEPGSLSVTRGSESIGASYRGDAAFGPGSSITFFGEAVEASAYTRQAKYRIKVDGAGATALEYPRTGRGNCRLHGPALDRFVHDPNRGYDVTSPHTTPWYAQRMARTSLQVATYVENFAITDLSADTATARIEIGLWGGINHAATPDHSVRLLLNGVEIARPRFDGLSYQAVAVELAPGTLRNGANALTVELLPDTGMSSDLVYLDDIRVVYSRELRAVDNRASFQGAQSNAPNGRCSGQSQCSKYLITGLTSPDIVVFRTSPGASPEPVSNVTVAPDGSGYQACFTIADSPADRFWVEPTSGTTPAGLRAAPAVTDPLAGAPGDYLIISSGAFIDALAPLVAQRTLDGYNVRVVDVAAIYDYYNQGVVDPDAIGAAISDAYNRLGTRFVLLVGADTYDYFDYLGTGSRSFLPTYYLPNGTSVRFAPSDLPYSDIDSDGRADVAIGRFPVRTAAEVENLVNKTLRYAQTAHAGKLLKVSDRSDGVPYESILSGLDSVFGAGTRTTNISLNNYANSATGLSLARTDIASAVNYGNSLLAYFGHGQISSWASGLINTAHINAGLFTNVDAPIVVWAMGCYGAYFTNPTGNSLAQALATTANGGGAVAVLGSTSLSYASSDIAWMNTLRPLLKNLPLGEAVRQAQRSLSALGPQYRDITVSGTLLGDPALRLR